MPRTAFILAAGLGTRLKPLTDNMPKALLPYKGEPLLKSLILKLKNAGFERIIVNVHHHAEMIENYLSRNNNFDVEIIISDEKDLLLDTGGAIKHIASYFDKDEQEPFLVHNCDMVSDIDLRLVYECHIEDDAVSSLIVSKRESSRYLLFDYQMRLCGWVNTKTGEVKSPYPQMNFMPVSELTQRYTALAFNGIHIISPKIFPLMERWGSKFSIIDFYINNAHREIIRSWRAPGKLRFNDVGKNPKDFESESLIPVSVAQEGDHTEIPKILLRRS